MQKLLAVLMFGGLILFYGIILGAAGYEGLILAFVLMAVLGAGALLVTRYLVSIKKTVTLGGVSRGYAERSVQEAIFVTEDQVVGFPSGTFNGAQPREDGALVAHEFVPKGSGNIVKKFVEIPWRIALWIVMGFSLFGGYGLAIGIVIAAFAFIMFLIFFVVPLALAWLIEITLKRFVGSVIVAEFQEREDAVDVTFTFKGVSALMVQNRLLRAFTPAASPERYQHLVPSIQSGSPS